MESTMADWLTVFSFQLAVTASCLAIFSRAKMEYVVVAGGW